MGSKGRKMGEMLKATESERAKGAAAGGKKTSPRGSYTERRDDKPTLADLGVTRKESSQAMMLAELPKAKSTAADPGQGQELRALRALVLAMLEPLGEAKGALERYLDGA